jgi:hypothetical protein
MFCIFHRSCSRSVDNGNCSTYPVAGVVAVNKHYRRCGFLDESVYTFEKKRKTQKRNPLKESKKAQSAEG